MSDASPDQLDDNLDESSPSASQSREFTADDNPVLTPGPELELLGSTKPSSIEVHDPSGSRSWWIPGGMLAVAAAAIVAWWIWPPSEEIRNVGGDGAPVTQSDSLPSYVLDTDGGRSQTAGSLHRYRRATRFEWTLRPESATSGEVGVRGFAFVDGGSAGLPLVLDALVKIAASGEIQIAGKVAQLGLEPGRYTIALAIGRPDALPEQAAALNTGSPRTWAVHRVEISIEE